MKIPNCTQAHVDIAKLRDYCLSTDHPRGRHKARVFASSLGLAQEDADLLQSTLITAACEAEAVTGMQDEYGQRYIIDFEMTHGDKTALIRSAWIILSDETFPRLVSCYVLPLKGDQSD